MLVQDWLFYMKEIKEIPHKGADLLSTSHSLVLFPSPPGTCFLFCVENGHLWTSDVIFFPSSGLFLVTWNWIKRAGSADLKGKKKNLNCEGHVVFRSRNTDCTEILYCVCEQTVVQWKRNRLVCLHSPFKYKLFTEEATWWTHNQCFRSSLTIQQLHLESTWL